jgi:predicted GIY-YIG superfamily endonuclease
MNDNQPKTYCIYKHTSPNGKSYIGCTSNLTNRSLTHKSQSRNGSNALFHEAIREFSYDSFKHEILIEGIQDKELANRIELTLIKESKTYHPNGYNIIGEMLSYKEFDLDPSTFTPQTPPDPMNVLINKLSRDDALSKEEIELRLNVKLIKAGTFRNGNAKFRLSEVGKLKGKLIGKAVGKFKGSAIQPKTIEKRESFTSFINSSIEPKFYSKYVQYCRDESINNFFSERAFQKAKKAKKSYD